MYINNINQKNNDTIFQIVSPEFKGIGKIVEHNEVYTTMMPHDDEEIEENWPAAGVTYKVYIPTKDILLLIVLKEPEQHKESS
jgi:hypothetical protein